MAKAKFDVYSHVTDMIIAEIEEGTPPWRKPWTGSAVGIALPERHNGEAYRGINVLMLWIVAAKQGFVSSRWMTYKQAQELGGQVKKGEKSSTVVKYGTFTRKNDDGEEEDVPYARAYRVFNADQIEGLPENLYIRPEAPRDLGTESDPELEAFFVRTGVEIVTSDEPQAYYSPAKDHIHMPPVSTFLSTQDYFATLAHEAIHWTGSEKRLARIKTFTTRADYATEELIAEIGNAMICAQLGLEPDFGQSAAYVESWLKALKEDKKAIFRAASQAQRAADFLLEAAGEGTKAAAA